MSAEAKVAALPICDFCAMDGKTVDAAYDFRTRSGPWANGCQRHYEQHRLWSDLGTGKGQRLVLREPR